MTLDSNERRIIIAALETYQSMWAVAVTEARTADDIDPADRRRDEELAQGRYDEVGELLAKFKRDPEGADTLAMVGKLDTNVAAEQARDREVRERGPCVGTQSAGHLYGLVELERLDHNLDDLRSADEEGEDE